MNANDHHSSQPTLVVFCKRPQFGQGKQRIATAIGHELTEQLAIRLLDTALEDASDWPGPVVIAPSAVQDCDWAQQLSGNHSVCAQPAGNLGQRLNGVDRLLRQAGSTSLIYIGSDAPLLDAGYLAQARRALESADVILGPAEDGGVVLMGSRIVWPDLQALPWSGHDLGKALELKCLNSGLTVEYLEPRYDIDFAHDLPRLYSDLVEDPRPARRQLCDWLVAAGLTEAEAFNTHETPS